ELATILGIDASNAGERRRKTLEKLVRMISVRGDAQANIVEVKVTSLWPALSEQLAAGAFEQVNEFNIERRRRWAASEREFSQDRVDAETGRLEAAENTLADFRKRNRSYANSPELALEHERLQRRVDLEQQVLASLLQNLERARIDELRNTPVVTPIDLPTGSAVPKPRGLVLALLLGLFFGA